MRKFLIHLVCAFAFLGFAAVEAAACSCVQLPNIPLRTLVGEAKTGARVVFSGKVVSVTENADRLNLKVRFEVADLWKGSAGRILEIETASNSAACGFAFEKGKEYLVYAYGRDAKSSGIELRAGLCTRTALLSQAKGDILFLGKRRKPSKS